MDYEAHGFFSPQIKSPQPWEFGYLLDIDISARGLNTLPLIIQNTRAVK